MPEPAPVGRPAEQELNPALRRIDWRFLLDDPWAERGTDRQVPLLNPGAQDLATAFDSLAPGGSCVCTWTRVGVGVPASARRALEHAGFVDVRAFWPWPWRPGATPEVWMPLGSDEAAAWFLDWRRAENPRGPGVRSAARGWAWGAAHRAGALRPVVTIGRRPGGVPGNWLDRFARQVREADAAADLAWALKTGGRRSINKIVALGFARDEASPVIVVKVGRTAEAERALAREADSLTRLRSFAERPIRGVPRMLGGWPAGAPRAIALGFERGLLMATLDVASHRRSALAITDWLVDLARVTRRPPGADWWRRQVEEPMERFTHDYASVLASDEIERMKTRLSTLGPMPEVFEQRDLSPWNVLRTESGGLAVLDWESSRPEGVPMLDLLYYLTFSSLGVQGAIERGSIPAYRAGRDPSTPLGRVAAECEDRYLAALELEEQHLAGLRLLVWMVHARGEFERLTADCGGAPTTDTLGTAVFLGLWREEIGAGRDRN